MVASAVPVVVLALLVRDAAAPVARFDQRVDVATTGFALAHDDVRRAAENGAGVLHPYVFRTAVLLVAVWLFRSRAKAAALWGVATMLTGTLLGGIVRCTIANVALRPPPVGEAP